MVCTSGVVCVLCVLCVAVSRAVRVARRVRAGSLVRRACGGACAVARKVKYAYLVCALRVHYVRYACLSLRRNYMRLWWGGCAAHPASPNACAASNCDVTVASLVPRCRSAAAAPARCVPASSPPWFVLSCVAAGWGSACAGLPSFASAGQNAVRWPGRLCPCRPCPCRLCLCLCRRRPCRRPCRGRRRLCRRRLCRRPCLSGRQHHPSVP